MTRVFHIPLDPKLLERLGNERRKVEEERSRISSDLRAAVRIAANEGWSKTRIAAVSGLSRQTVHEMLKEER